MFLKAIIFANRLHHLGAFVYLRSTGDSIRSVHPLPCFFSRFSTTCWFRAWVYVPVPMLHQLVDYDNPSMKKIAISVKIRVDHKWREFPWRTTLHYALARPHSFHGPLVHLNLFIKISFMSLQCTKVISSVSTIEKRFVLWCQQSPLHLSRTVSTDL